jgi:hypothetical protein
MMPDAWQIHEQTLDALPIGDQVRLFRNSIDYACAAIQQATVLGRHLRDAANAGVLTPAESREFSEAILTDARALQAGLVLFLSGRNTDRETLEQLRLIFLPGGPTLDDQLAMADAGLPPPSPDSAWYWTQLLEYKQKLRAGG